MGGKKLTLNKTYQHLPVSWHSVLGIDSHQQNKCEEKCERGKACLCPNIRSGNSYCMCHHGA